LDDPGENAGAFFTDEDLRQVLDLLLFGDLVEEGHQAQAPPERVASGLHLRLVVTHQPQVVGRFEGEKRLAHVPGGDGVAAGELLHLRFVELGVLVDL
jgi:hypothetical protein